MTASPSTGQIPKINIAGISAEGSNQVGKLPGALKVTGITARTGLQRLKHLSNLHQSQSYRLRKSPGCQGEQSSHELNDIESSQPKSLAVAEENYTLPAEVPNPPQNNTTAALKPNTAVNLSEAAAGPVRANSSSKTKKTKKKSRLSRKGWLPDQHGAYAMVVLPFWIGVLLSAFTWKHLLVFSCWVLGFFSFFALSLWFKSGQKKRYAPPVRVYLTLTIILGTATVLVLPQLLEWGMIFIPLALIAAIQAYLRKERTLLARLVSILSAGLITLVAYDVGIAFNRGFWPLTWLDHPDVTPTTWVESPTGQVHGWAWAGLVALGIVMYYWSTVPYVRSLVRQKGSSRFWYFSVLNHFALLILVVVQYFLSWVSLTYLVVWILLAIRAVAVPLYSQKHPGRITVRQIGLSELVVSLIVFASLLFF